MELWGVLINKETSLEPLYGKMDNKLKRLNTKPMTNEFVPYEQALALKELGFDEPCFGLWNLNNGKHEVDIIGVCEYSKEFKYREVLAPTYSQAFRWFREKYGFFHYVTTHDSTDFEWYIYDKYQNDWEDDIVKNTYEEAELACLKKLIELSTPTA
jgi:hypothetical protein